MSVTLTPLGSRLLVRPLAGPEKVGSIYIPSQHREYAIKGEVLEVGPEVRDIEVGMVVLFPAAAGQEVGSDRLIQESSILATV